MNEEKQEGTAPESHNIDWRKASRLPWHTIATKEAMEKQTEQVPTDGQLALGCLMRMADAQEQLVTLFQQLVANFILQRKQTAPKKRAKK